ncbi:MAG: hypothetical protein ACRDUV_04660 [Pseudonocardiaceae bacterium]
MAADSRLESQAARRSWVVLLYFYAAALVGLGFVVTGTTVGLFGAKSALFPGLGLSSYSYEYRFPPDSPGPTGPTEQQLQAAKDRAIDDRRSRGLDDMLSGLIIAGVGAPVLIWHLKRGRNVGAEKPGGTTPPTPPAPPQPPAPRTPPAEPLPGNSG